MANTIYGLTNYYNAFISPLKSYQVNPLTNLIYGSTASSIYSQTVAKKAQSSLSSYLTSMNNEASTIKASAKALGFQRTDSSFAKKAVTSADTSSISGTAAWNADAGNHTITVTKLAEGQTNISKELKSSDSSAFSQGLNTFSIKTGNSVKTAAFTINAADTNKSALDKMASAINKSNAGIIASVVSDTKAGTSYLKLTSNETGTNSAFELTDTIGNAVAATGANTIEKNAQNSEYILDGKQNTSQSNTISFDNGKAQLTLKKAENKEISFSIGSDTASMENSIKKFVEDYNDIINLANDHSDTLQGAEALGANFSSAVNSRKNTLSNIGITINADNTLRVDEKKLTNALKNNMSYVKDVFSGYGGIAEKVYSKANEVLSSPLKYSSSNLSTSALTSYYSSLFNTGSTADASQLFSGMLFDMSL